MTKCLAPNKLCAQQTQPPSSQGLNENLAEVITNNPLQPFDFIPPTIGNRLNRNVVSLFGFDAVDK